MANDALRGYLIFCIVLILIAAVFSLVSESRHKTRIINADERDTGIILSALSKSDKNVTEHITSITVVEDVSILGKMDCMALFLEVGGCAATTFLRNNSFKTDIYLASRELLRGTCLTFENVVYHEIGHVVYFQKYGNSGTYTNDQEPYAIDYANRFAKDNCNRKQS